MRHYQCDACKGTVAIPLGRRVITIDTVRTVHDATCPAVKVVKR